MELLTKLSEQLSIIGALTEITRRERNALKNRDIPAMHCCRQEAASLQELLIDLEQKRSALCGGLSLKEIAAQPDAPTDQLLELRRTLKAALRELKSEHDTNIIFYKHEMAYLHQIREAINQESTMPHYTKAGTIAQANETATMSRRA